MTKRILAWHFLPGDGTVLANTGDPVPPDGVWIEVAPPIKLCERGLHASLSPLDALQYARGSVVCRVELAGDVLYGDDKLCATKRRILWRIDAEHALRAFARRCALDVIHLWDAPEIVVRYLRTSDEAIGAAAWGAARGAAWGAAWGAARDAAFAAAQGAARTAARDAQSRRLTRMLLAEHRRVSR
jgi:hypothetical protein